MLFLSTASTAQVVFSPVFTQISLEARGDFDYININRDFPVNDSTATGHPYGFHGKYFNFVVGGDLNDKFSYFFRQRIIAHPGHVSLFDNTDFLYLTYHPTKNWMFRLGKDALAVGGFEYDAAPIDVLFSTNYWDNFYCFQLGGATAYKSSDGNHTLLLQVANSPYVYYGAGLGTSLGSEWKAGLLAYSLFWSGTFGHFKTLYSVNMFERPDNKYMNYIALGHKLLYDRWDIYVDLIHHELTGSEWGSIYAAVSCLNVHITDAFNIFIKGAYERNHSKSDMDNPAVALDCLISAGNELSTYGIGFEYTPSFCKDVRLHGFVANRVTNVHDNTNTLTETTSSLTANIGITWHMNIHRMFLERGL